MPDITIVIASLLLTSGQALGLWWLITRAPEWISVVRWLLRGAKGQRPSLRRGSAPRRALTGPAMKPRGALHAVGYWDA